MNDLLDLTALEVEQNNTPFGFKWGDEEFTIDAGGLDLRVAGLLRRGDWGAAVEMLMGDEEWARLLDVKAVDADGKRLPFQLEHAIALVNGYSAHLGTTVGKSRASSRSSRRTGTPSKRTSSSTSRRGSQK